jgi:hypothetical protein
MKRDRGKSRVDSGDINNGKTNKVASSTTARKARSCTESIRARLGKKALPFYALMKKMDKKFEWTEEADATFAHLKKCSPHHRCWSHQNKGNHYYYTSLPHMRW